MKLLRYQERIRLDLNRVKPSKQPLIKLNKGKIDALWEKSNVLELIGGWGECQEIRERALYLAEKIKDKSRIGKVNNELGNILYDKGIYDEAMECYEKALKIAKKLGNKNAISKAMGSNRTYPFQKRQL